MSVDGTIAQVKVWITCWWAEADLGEGERWQVLLDQVDACGSDVGAVLEVLEEEGLRFGPRWDEVLGLARDIRRWLK